MANAVGHYFSPSDLDLIVILKTKIDEKIAGVVQHVDSIHNVDSIFKLKPDDLKEQYGDVKGIRYFLSTTDGDSVRPNKRPRNLPADYGVWRKRGKSQPITDDGCKQKYVYHLTGILTSWTLDAFTTTYPTGEANDTILCGLYQRTLRRRRRAPAPALAPAPAPALAPAPAPAPLPAPAQAPLPAPAPAPLQLPAPDPAPIPAPAPAPAPGAGGLDVDPLLWAPAQAAGGLLDVWDPAPAPVAGGLLDVDPLLWDPAPAPIAGGLDDDPLQFVSIDFRGRDLQFLRDMFP